MMVLLLLQTVSRVQGRMVLILLQTVSRVQGRMVLLHVLLQTVPNPGKDGVTTVTNCFQSPGKDGVDIRTIQYELLPYYNTNLPVPLQHCSCTIRAKKRVVSLSVNKRSIYNIQI